MTPSVITSIVLAFALGVAAMVAALHYHKAKSLRADNRSLRAKVDRYRAADRDHKGAYDIVRVDPSEDVAPEIWCEWAVVRRTIIGGYMHSAIIKAFTDEDDDFNRRQAEELVEKLNEK